MEFYQVFSCIPSDCGSEVMFEKIGDYKTIKEANEVRDQQIAHWAYRRCDPSECVFVEKCEVPQFIMNESWRRSK